MILYIIYHNCYTFIFVLFLLAYYLSNSMIQFNSTIQFTSATEFNAAIDVFRSFRNISKDPHRASGARSGAPRA